MRLPEATANKVLDKRLRDKLITEGSLTQADLDKYLGDLPDDAANMTTTADIEAAATTSTEE